MTYFPRKEFAALPGMTKVMLDFLAALNTVEGDVTVIEGDVTTINTSITEINTSITNIDETLDGVNFLSPPGSSEPDATTDYSGVVELATQASGCLL